MKDKKLNHVVIRRIDGGLMYLSARPYNKFKPYEAASVLEIGQPIDRRNTVDEDNDPMVHFGIGKFPKESLKLSALMQRFPITMGKVLSHIERGEVVTITPEHSKSNIPPLYMWIGEDQQYATGEDAAQAFERVMQGGNG